VPLEKNPYTPPAPGPLLMEAWGSCNTSTTRMGVKDDEVWFYDGFMPLDQKNLRTLYDVGTTLYTAPNGVSIVFFAFANILSTPYVLFFQSDGSVVAVNTNTANISPVLPAGSILGPSQLTIGVSQWGQQYAIIVAAQTNGYWLWDGSVTYSTGSIGPVVIITNGGSGYISPPFVGLIGGSGGGAVFSASISNGTVVSVQVINPGMGYLSTDTPTLTFTGGNTAGSGGSINAYLAHSAGGSGATIGVTLIKQSGGGGAGVYDAFGTLTADGSGYSPYVVVHVSGGVGPLSGTPGIIKPNVVAGAITSITVTFEGAVQANGNFGAYTGSVAPTVSIVDPGYYYIATTTVENVGSGYSNYPVLSVVDATGSIRSTPALTASVVGGTIAGVDIVSGGVFGSNVMPTIVITDVASVAAGSVTLMPYGVSGNCVETYSGHVWVGSRSSGTANLQWSAPGSPSNFATSAGGGSEQATQSYLKIGYTRLVQSNGFLYLIADSSIDYISGVQTSGVPPTTSFTQQNADPTIGTPYPWSVILHGQDILFANSIGVYGVAGARPAKISAMLDGIWNNPTNFAGLNLSAAHATIFNREVWMTLATFVNPITSATVTQPVMWDGKRWFSSPQNLSLTFIGSQEINSVFTAYGTDGTVVAPLFNTPSTNFAKRVQSKLWAEPGGYLLTKATNRFWAVLDYYSISSASITAFIDSVCADSSNAGSISYTSAGYTIAGPSITGPWVIPPMQVGQQGILTGFSLKTNCADMAVVSAMIDDKAVGYRG